MAAASSLPSHGSRPAVAAACAVAAGVSLGVHGGYSSLDILRAAADGAAFGEKKGMDLPAPSVARRLRLVEEIVDQAGDTSTSDILDELVAVFGASMMAYESLFMPPTAMGQMVFWLRSMLEMMQTPMVRSAVAYVGRSVVLCRFLSLGV